MGCKFIPLTGIIILIFSISSVSAMGAGKKSESAGKECAVSSFGKSHVTFCKNVSRMIVNGTIDEDKPESEAMPVGNPNSVRYLDLDIDGDGKADTVTVSSGSEGESLLEVRLSSGSVYEIHESGFIMIVKMKGHIYALVTYWIWEMQPDGSRKGKKVGYRLYELAKHGAELVCDGRDT